MVRILALLVVLWVVPAAAAPSQDDAVAAAKTWLAVVDAGHYPASWKTAADLFQQGVSEPKWDGMVMSIRDKLGPLKSREYQAAELTKTLPGVPDGDYAVVRFQSAFANKAEAVKSITLILEHGSWKVGGFFIN